MPVNSITLNLPDTVYKRAQRTASLLNRSVEDLLEDMLNRSLPELDDTSSKIATEMAELPGLTDTELWKVARSRMKSNREALLHKLLDIQSERQLTKDEAHRLEALHQEAGKLTLLKSQAYALLHQRGYPVPRP